MLNFKTPASMEDFAAMSRIHAQGWRTTYPEDVPADYMEEVITDDHWTEQFHKEQASGKGHCLMLCRDDVPVSCLTYGAVRVGTVSVQSLPHTISAQGYEGWGEILTFYSDPKETGKGYGGLLLEEALNRLREEGYSNVYVFVLDKNERSRAFYERHGFRWDGTWEDIPFPHGYICRDLRYVREL
jgi:RimJ/RimL family protein N-acetyltransferase